MTEDEDFSLELARLILAEKEAGRRVGMSGKTASNWYVSNSPRNGWGSIIEGPWEDWVELARPILAENERRGNATDKGGQV